MNRREAWVRDVELLEQLEIPDPSGEQGIRMNYPEACENE